jgi:LmbE family N-acetylglucosaminyl deacetylase
MRIHVIVAHPDDAVFACGGTIAKHADRGDDVTVTYLTRGEWGGEADEDERAETRENEARNCVDILGGTPTFLDEKDGRVTENLDTRFAIVNELRSTEPDVVLTWYPDDPHPDHRITSQLVQDAVYQVSTRNLKTEAPPADRPEMYYFGKSWTSFNPSAFVNIDGYFEQKLNGFLAHESEVERLESTRDMNVSEAIRTRAEAYGQISGVPLAEGFIPKQHSATEYLD